jgi:hypothetical protein
MFWINGPSDLFVYLFKRLLLSPYQLLARLTSFPFYLSVIQVADCVRISNLKKKILSSGRYKNTKFEKKKKHLTRKFLFFYNTRYLRSGCSKKENFEEKKTFTI